MGYNEETGPVTSGMGPPLWEDFPIRKTVNPFNPSTLYPPTRCCFAWVPWNGAEMHPPRSLEREEFGPENPRPSQGGDSPTPNSSHPKLFGISRSPQRKQPRLLYTVERSA